MGFGWQEIDKTLDLGYIRVAGLHRECKPAVLRSTQLSPPHHDTCTYVQYVSMCVCTYIRMYVHAYVCMYVQYVCTNV